MTFPGAEVIILNIPSEIFFFTIDIRLVLKILINYSSKLRQNIRIQIFQEPVLLFFFFPVYGMLY